MIATYKTKTAFEFILDRKKQTGIIYLEIGIPTRESTGYKPKGKYYTLIQTGTKEVNSVDENDNEVTETVPVTKKVVLDSFRGIIPFALIKQIEDTMLPDFSNVKNIDDAFIERTKQFVMIKIDSEHQEDPQTNWGITSSDLEEVVDEEA